MTPHNTSSKSRSSFLTGMKVVILAFVTLFSGVQPAQATDTPGNTPGNSANETPDDTLSMLDQPMGQMRKDIWQSLQEKWQSEPVCTTLRTGYGKNRRAYFLDTCTFKNPLGHTLWDATPSIVEYRFLENSLVQMSFEFDEMADVKKFRRCAKEQNEQLSSTADKQLVIKVDEDFRTTLSDIEQVGQIHSLRHTL